MISDHNGDAEAAFRAFYESRAFDKDIFEGLQAPIFWDGKALLKMVSLQVISLNLVILILDILMLMVILL